MYHVYVLELYSIVYCTYHIVVYSLLEAKKNLMLTVFIRIHRRLKHRRQRKIDSRRKQEKTFHKFLVFHPEGMRLERS